MGHLPIQEGEMTSRSSTRFVARVEMWNCAIVLVLAAIATTTSTMDPLALLAGGIFMGVNFLLLGTGVRWIISPNMSKKRRRIGMSLLVLKLFLFLGLISTVFVQIKLDVVSFIVGVSSLLVASVIAGLTPEGYGPLAG
jgi:hypothetical protein